MDDVARSINGGANTLSHRYRRRTPLPTQDSYRGEKILDSPDSNLWTDRTCNPEETYNVSPIYERLQHLANTDKKNREDYELMTKKFKETFYAVSAERNSCRRLINAVSKYLKSLEPLPGGFCRLLSRFQKPKDDFQHPKRIVKTDSLSSLNSLTSVNAPVLENSFTTIQPQKEDAMEAESDHESISSSLFTANSSGCIPNPPQRNKKQLPIHIQMPPNWSEHTVKIFKLTGLCMKLHADFFVIRPESSEQTELILNYLLEKKIPFFKFSDKSDRPRKVLVKGMPVDFNMEEIKQALTQMNFPVINCIRLRSRNPKSKGQPLPNVLCYVEPSCDFQTLFKVNVILHFQVKVVNFRNTAPKQCFNCQRFGHNSTNCFLPTACVKCAGPHSAKDCPLKPSDPPKCINCSQKHTSNFTGCSYNPKNPKYHVKARGKAAKIPFFRPN